MRVNRHRHFDVLDGEPLPSTSGGFEQVGCVYTAQGFEYDWNGVVLGPDLVYRDGRLITVRGASKDPALMKKSVTDEQADRLIRNTYKVLLTRGMIGTAVHSVDARTQEFLTTLLDR
ncbi:DNA/RNA helicase domain-containing protein [Microbispora bryophytorum]|uniref:DNA/RNA helicase domain-containing protein n=1 Tax=Microbispora bryophytorum TaxID=1460882 RepID=UPI0033C6F0F3